MAYHATMQRPHAVFFRGSLALALCAPFAASSGAGALAVDMSSVAALEKPAPGGRPWSQPELRALQQAIETALEAPTLRGAAVGFLALDTTRKTVLYTQNSDRDFMPASNFKLLTGSAALRLLGPEFTYVTSVAADAAPSEGIVTGNLYLRGGGDALLSVKDLQDAAAALADQGITRVNGALVTGTQHHRSRERPDTVLRRRSNGMRGRQRSLFGRKPSHAGNLHLSADPELFLAVSPDVRSLREGKIVSRNL